MRKLIILASVLLAACEGPAGPQGPQGPAGPNIDRSKMYCATASNAAHLGNNVYSRDVLCASAGDIPLSGECYLPAVANVSEYFYLSDSSPLGWTNTSLQAGWTCQWSPRAGAPTPLPFPGVAEICCYTP